MGKFTAKEGVVPQHEQVFEIVKAMPGSRLTEISQLVDFRRESVSARLSQLKREGRVKSEDGKYYVGDGTPQLPVIPNKLRMRKSTKDNLRIIELEEQILQLKEWQEAAIKKHPDLAVKPEVLEARKVAEDYYARRGEVKMANEIKAGKHDDAPFMHMILAAMA